MTAISSISGSVQISVPQPVLFDFVSNLSNDHHWRTEIKKTFLHGSPAIGTLATEESYLSKKLPRHLLELQCTHWEPDYMAIWETVKGSPFYLKSIRKVRPHSDHQSIFDYMIEFDKSIVYKALGFKIPGFLITIGAKRDMKEYLANLHSHFRK